MALIQQNSKNEHNKNGQFVGIINLVIAVYKFIRFLIKSKGVI